MSDHEPTPQHDGTPDGVGHDDAVSEPAPPKTPRRRRSASRAAGPPQVSPATIPEPAAVPEPTTSTEPILDRESAVGIEPAPSAGPAAGSESTTSAEPSAITVPEADVEPPTSEAPTAVAEDAPRARTRRRAATRPAGRPDPVTAAPATASSVTAAPAIVDTATGDGATAGTASAEGATTEPVPSTRPPRKRAARKRAPAPTPAEDQPSVAADDGPAAPLPSASAEPEPAPAADGRTGPVTAGAPDPVTPDAVTPDAVTPDAVTPDAVTPDPAAPDAGVAGRRRGRRSRPTGQVADPFAPVEPQSTAPVSEDELSAAVRAVFDQGAGSAAGTPQDGTDEAADPGVGPDVDAGAGAGAQDPDDQGRLGQAPGIRSEGWRSDDTEGAEEDDLEDQSPEDESPEDEGPEDESPGDQDSEGPSRNRRRRRRGGRRRRRGGADGDDQDGASPDGADQDADQDDADQDRAHQDRADQDRARQDGASQDGADQDTSRDGPAAEAGTARGEGHEGGSAEQDPQDEDSGGSGEGGRRRRRRRRRRGEDSGSSEDDPSDTVTRVREPRRKRERSGTDQITGIEGSTRLEAKRQRRRDGRQSGRRRTPILSEAEFLARREAVERTMIIRQGEDLSQLAVLEDGVLVEHYVDRESATSLIGNVYLARVQNVLPSMEAAFVDIGRGRNAVLYAGEVDWDAHGAAKSERQIEKVLKSGQTVLVQVTKDPVGAKGARLTNHISIPGRYVVYSPGGHLSGISRKLPEPERKRLKDILSDLVGEHASVIVRTAAEGASEDELVRDVNRLKAQWEAIEKKIRSNTAPQLLHAEPDLTLRIVRDLFTEDFSSLVVDGNGEGSDAHGTVSDYVGHVAPHLADRLQRWDREAKGDVFAAHRLDEQIAKALDRKVFLPSGGSLIIDRTEAMTVIDVNTGKFTGSGGNLETTVTSNNLEAAEEVVRQLRLRDIGGIIVIDFIDMVLPSNRELLLRRLVECLGRDRTRHQVAEVTSLGLVQMTRKKIGTGLAEAFTETCEHCSGLGYHTHEMPVPTQAQVDGGERPGRRGRSGRNKGGGKGGKTGGSGTETPEPPRRNGGPQDIAAAMAAKEHAAAEKEVEPSPGVEAPPVAEPSPAAEPDAGAEPSPASDGAPEPQPPVQLPATGQPEVAVAPTGQAEVPAALPESPAVPEPQEVEGDVDPEGR